MSAHFAAPPPLSGQAPWVRAVNRSVLEQSMHGRQAGVSAREMPAPPFGLEPGIRFSPAAAEQLVREGLKAALLADLAQVAGIDVKHLYEFAGIDRTTVLRRAARDDALPQEAAVKALQFTELAAQAVDVFGEPPVATRWLTEPHPLLDGDTPLQRARTPWGMQRVQALLGALKYGAAA